MKFMVSLITDGSAMEGMTPEEMSDFGRRMGEYMEQIRSAGVLVNTGRLGPADAARTIRPGDGESVVTDGPFAETKEQIGGYMVLECEDLDAAVAWVERMPVLGGALEVRPITDYDERANA
ncbi:MAG TPA: YciI family protein [Solirubrobacterales bacterium]|nr:YciI family protein [Solirubrobacterales bacterium]